MSPAWVARLLEAFHVDAHFLQVMLAFGDEPHHSEACNGYNWFRETETDGCNYQVTLSYTRNA